MRVRICAWRAVCFAAPVAASDNTLDECLTLKLKLDTKTEATGASESIRQHLKPGNDWMLGTETEENLILIQSFFLEVWSVVK